jgi:hypothetical protein
LIPFSLVTEEREFAWLPGGDSFAQFANRSPPYRLVPQLVNLPGVWQTVGMTKKREFPQHREDRKVQKLVERIVQQQALQAKAVGEQDQVTPPRS